MTASEQTQPTSVPASGCAQSADHREPLYRSRRRLVAYRRFGNAETLALPLVMLQHFRDNLDSWDPALLDRLAQDRVDNRGVGGSTGVGPDNVTDMARDALGFIDALGRSRSTCSASP